MAISYGVSGDIRDSLGNPSESEYSASAITLARLRATNVINAYLEPAYPEYIPIGSAGDVPGLVDTIATDLAVYYLKRDKHKGPNPMSDVVKSEYWDKNIQLLEKIGKGEMQIPEWASEEGGNIMAGSTGPDGKPYVPTFDEGPIEDSVVDPNKLDDIADAKEK